MWTKLKETTKPIVLYGMGDGADKIVTVLERYGINVAGVFVSDGFVRNKLYRGMPLMSYDDAKKSFGDMVVLVAFGTSLPDVMANVKRIASEQELYVPDVPVYGNNVFDVEFARNNRGKLEKVYNSLADEASRFVFESTVKYKLTGNPKYLFSCESSPDYTYGLLDIKEGAVAVDCGAYIGDTVEEYLKYAPIPKTIHAIEPDPKTYKRLCKNCAEYPFVNCVNAAVTDVVGKITFAGGGSRSSSIKGVGTEVDAISIDAILDGANADFIKMDVEGNEKRAIEGARNTIINYKPKLFISCYHRSEDIFEIPLQLFDLRPDYKIHMTHYPYIPAWDTAFVCI